jgi:hypothetical protein
MNLAMAQNYDPNKKTPQQKLLDLLPGGNVTSTPKTNQALQTATNNQINKTYPQTTQKSTSTTPTKTTTTSTYPAPATVSTPTVIEQEMPVWLQGETRTNTATASTSNEDMQDYINELKEAQIAARISALDKSLGNSLANLDTEKASISPYFYNKRNEAAARSDLSALNFAQRAAARGISGNAGAMPEIYRTNALQGQIGALDQAEVAENARIERNRSLLRNNYEADITAAQAGVEATALQNIINQINQDRSFALQEAGTTGVYKGQQTLEGQAQELANKKAQMDIAAQEIANSYLPETYKLEAERLRQQVEAGRIDIDTALAQLQRIRAGGISGGWTKASALDAWNSGIDTPEIRSILGL